MYVYHDLFSARLQFIFILKMTLILMNSATYDLLTFPRDWKFPGRVPDFCKNVEERRNLEWELNQNSKQKTKECWGIVEWELACWAYCAHHCSFSKLQSFKHCRGESVAPWSFVAAGFKVSRFSPGLSSSKTIISKHTVLAIMTWKGGRIFWPRWSCSASSKCFSVITTNLQKYALYIYCLWELKRTAIQLTTRIARTAKPY